MRHSQFVRTDFEHGSERYKEHEIVHDHAHRVNFYQLNRKGHNYTEPVTSFGLARLREKNKEEIASMTLEFSKATQFTLQISWKL